MAANAEAYLGRTRAACSSAASPSAACGWILARHCAITSCPLSTWGRRGQVVRRGTANPLFPGSNPGAASNLLPARTPLSPFLAPPLLAEFYTWLGLAETKALPRSALGKAIIQARNQGSALERYVDDRQRGEPERRGRANGWSEDIHPVIKRASDLCTRWTGRYRVRERIRRCSTEKVAVPMFGDFSGVPSE